MTDIQAWLNQDKATEEPWDNNRNGTRQETNA